MMRKFSLSADGFFYVPSIGDDKPDYICETGQAGDSGKRPVCRRARPYRFSVGIHRACRSFSRRPGADLPFAQYVVAGAGVAACRDAAVCFQTADHGKRHGTVRLRKRRGPFLIRERKRRASFAERH